MADILAVHPDDMKAIGSNLSYIANGLQSVVNDVNSVTGHVNKVDEKVDQVSNEFKTLTEELKSFMNETKNLSVVGNAKQSIVMIEQDLEKKYGHYDIIRRRLLSILESSDSSLIKKSTLESLSDEAIINTPSYYLAPALVAVSAWYNNDKTLADKAINDAMDKDDEKTSLLMSYITKKANRSNASLAWIKRYLYMQDPTLMEKKIETVLDSLTNGTFDQSGKQICLERVSFWLEELRSRDIYRNKIKDRWVTFINESMTEIPDNFYPYLNITSDTYSKMKDNLSFALVHNEMINYFTNILNDNSENTLDIESIIKSLVYNYDNEEQTSRLELNKNKLIIETNGDLNKTYELLEKHKSSYDITTDFLDHLTNIVFGNNTKVSSGTRKFALSLISKDILNAYNYLITSKNYNHNLEIRIKIFDFIGTTKDGRNEKELISSINNHIDNLTSKDLEQTKLINIKMIIAVILSIIGTIFTINIPIVPIVLPFIGIGYAIYEYVKANQTRKIKLANIKELKKKYQDTLISVLAEVIDYKNHIEQGQKSYITLVNLLSNLNPENYLLRKNDNGREIIIDNEGRLN